MIYRMQFQSRLEWWENGLIQTAFCAYFYFGMGSTLALQQQHIKGPSHCAESVGGRLKLNMHTPTQCELIC